MKHIGATGDLDKIALDITTEIVVARVQSISGGINDKTEGEYIGEMFKQIHEAVTDVVNSVKSN